MSWQEIFEQRKAEEDNKYINGLLKSDCPAFAKYKTKRRSKKKYKHPKTKTYVSLVELAAEQGIQTESMGKRIRRLGLEKAVTENSKNIWTAEETKYLIQVWATPNLHKLWNEFAHKNGYPQRTHNSIKCKIKRMRDEGLIGYNRDELRFSSGWFTIAELSKYLDVSIPTLNNWIAKYGLKYYSHHNSLGSDRVVHAKDFLQWSVTPKGIELLYKRLTSSELLSYWYLNLLSDWGVQSQI